MEPNKSNGWGGKCKGAGRPRGKTIDVSFQRKQHQVCAFDDEWKMIKEFANVVKKDRARAERMMKTE